MKKNKRINIYAINDYVVDENKGTVIYAENFHDTVLVSKATCSKSDTFDVDKGKQIAYYRVQLNKRIMNLCLIQEYKVMQQTNMRFIEVHHGHVPHKLFMKSIQEAVKLEKIEQRHINNIRAKLVELTA